MTSASALIRATVSAGSSMPSKSWVTSSRPSTNTKLRTLENCELMACTRWSVKRAKDATDPEMSAMTKISAWPVRWLEAQVDRYAAGGEAATHGVAKVNRTATTTSATARQSHGQFATQRSKRALELAISSRLACMTSSLRQRLTHRLGQGLDPRSSTRRSRITRSISAFSISMRERASSRASRWASWSSSPDPCVRRRSRFSRSRLRNVR